jgi:hypothetical protein
MFTESKIIKQITILPQTNSVNVQWANQVLKGTDVISETFERKAYDANLTGFNTEVGQLDVNAFLAAFNAATLDDKAAAVAAKTAAEAALAQALADKDAAVAAATAPLQAEIARLTALVPVPVTATSVVTMRQARLALLQVGKYADVSTAIASMPEPQKTAATIEWEYASTVERSSAFVASMATALGLTAAEMDSLFALAASL